MILWVHIEVVTQLAVMLTFFKPLGNENITKIILPIAMAYT